MCITHFHWPACRFDPCAWLISIARVIFKDDVSKRAHEYQRILVATDFSNGAREALDFALNIRRQFQSKVFLVHVINAAVFHYVSPEGQEDAARQANVFAVQEMERLVEEAGCAGEVERVILSSGPVWPMLQGFAKSNAVDLLVLGTHGSSPAKDRLLGPVAEEVFRLAERPVLTVGSNAEKPQRSSHKIQRILYATNFKPHAERAAAYAYALEREHGAHLTVLHIVEEQAIAAKEGLEIVQEFLVRRMRRGMPAECVGKCEPDFLVKFGEPAEEILRLAREQEADLIVLGMRSGKHTTGLLPSAVAYKLACQSPCPVLTVRH
jgi:nucleotide-binding universal stress UspA family protein